MFKLFSFIQNRKKLKKHKKVCNKHNYCYPKMLKEYNKTLEYNHGEKSLKVPFLISADLECLLKKSSTEKSSTEKKALHIPSGYSLFTSCSFDQTKNKRDCYRGKDCIEKFCKDLREHAMRIVNYEKKEMVPLTDKEIESYEKQNICHICKKEFSTDKNDENTFKLYHIVRDNCYYTGKFRGAAHSICNLKYKTPKKIPVVFHNVSTFDYHFIIKQLAKEFKGQFECLGENSEKYITFSVPIKKKLDNGKTITYRLKFIDGFRFMASKLSDLVDNLSEIYKKECITFLKEEKSSLNAILLGLKITDYITNVKNVMMNHLNQ